MFTLFYVIYFVSLNLTGFTYLYGLIRYSRKLLLIISIILLLIALLHFVDFQYESLLPVEDFMFLLFLSFVAILSFFIGILAEKFWLLASAIISNGEGNEYTGLAFKFFFQKIVFVWITIYQIYSLIKIY